jgi:lysine N6-hydroxylase
MRPLTQSIMRPTKRDVIGVGIGPSNLSLAALLHPIGRLNAAFLDQKPEFQWHPGLMIPGAALQVHFLKDLVSLVDPTSRYSFLFFLAKKGRLLQFINASFSRVLRCEFEEYYRWVSKQIPGLLFDSFVENVAVEDGALTLDGSGGRWRTGHLVIGSGLTPYIPPAVVNVICPTVMHASDFMHRKIGFAGKRISVIGGGQTGAEIFKYLIDLTTGAPSRVDWISRRANFLPLDESAFTNELYTPEYSDYFFDLPRNTRASLICDQKLASDGVSDILLSSIFRRIYEIQYLRSSFLELSLRPARELVSMSKGERGWRLTLQHAHRDIPETVDTDIVILATGYKTSLPPYLSSIAKRIAWDDGFQVEEDFSIQWDGPPNCKIYVQGYARNQRGVADPNLGLIPWRNATIINSIMGAQLYDCSLQKSFVDWGVSLIDHEDSTLLTSIQG